MHISYKFHLVVYFMFLWCFVIINAESNVENKEGRKETKNNQQNIATGSGAKGK